MRSRIALIFTGICALFIARSDARANAPTGQYTVDATNGTVTDHKTGLVWQQTAVPPRRTLADATNYCQTLSIGALTTGWRVPNVREALSIVNPSQIAPPLMDQSAFNTTAPGQIWTTTPDVSDPTLNWIIDLTGAFMKPADPTTTQGVFCVH